MRKIDQNAGRVHLVHRVAAEIGQAAVMAFVAARADQVLRVVGKLHDTHAQILEDAQQGKLVVDPARVLPAEDDAGLALGFGAADVGGAVDLDNQVRVLEKPLLPGGDMGERTARIFPHATGAVGGGEPAFRHVFEDRAAPIGDD